MRFDRNKLWEGVRTQFYPGKAKLTRRTVNALEYVLSKVEEEGDAWELIEWIAYALATWQWETRQRTKDGLVEFEPVKEKRANKKTQAKLYQSQSRYWGHEGRGLTQVTWKDNYYKVGEHFKGATVIDGNGRSWTLSGDVLVKNPDLMLNSWLSFKGASWGIREGRFRAGHTLARYIQKGKKPDYYNARNIINVNHDRAEEIAKAAVKWEMVLRFSRLPETAKTIEAPPTSLISSPATQDEAKTALGLEAEGTFPPPASFEERTEQILGPGSQNGKTGTVPNQIEQIEGIEEIGETGKSETPEAGLSGPITEDMLFQSENSTKRDPVPTLPGWTPPPPPPGPEHTHSADREPPPVVDTPTGPTLNAPPPKPPETGVKPTSLKGWYTAVIGFFATSASATAAWVAGQPAPVIAALILAGGINTATLLAMVIWLKNGREQRAAAKDVALITRG